MKDVKHGLFPGPTRERQLTIPSVPMMCHIPGGRDLPPAFTKLSPGEKRAHFVFPTRVCQSGLWPDSPRNTGTPEAELRLSDLRLPAAAPETHRFAAGGFTPQLEIRRSPPSRTSVRKVCATGLGKVHCAAQRAYSELQILLSTAHPSLVDSRRLVRLNASNTGGFRGVSVPSHYIHRQFAAGWIRTLNRHCISFGMLEVCLKASWPCR
ncbi:hypothetical protein B0H17DRAFT_1146561 [Mycena rosella]|uniref:Uncharacterized protein n=1 Tax=Mycena rosella TaxID=1033263 RepID=A0AAD7CNN8_MYCRO|nr:hypothetical protein B0H17DRAFT_1146561 [Mycena rosella]